MEKTTNDHIHLDVVNITNRNITPDSTGLFMVNAITEKGYEGYNATTKEKVYFYDGDAVGVETWGSFTRGVKTTPKKPADTDEVG